MTPPLGSGLRLQPTKPSSSTQRRNSATERSMGTPGDWGSWQTPAKWSGKSCTTRATRSLLTCVQRALTPSSPMWCPIAEARGEKTVRSIPRSRISRSWLPSTEERSSSSVMSG